MLASKPISHRASSWVCHGCRQLRQEQQQSLNPFLTRRGQRRRYAASSAASSHTSRQDLQKLPDTAARTRFAPSPTGFMHLGSLRTALFNYLIAKATGGKFLLRIEDTDTKRTVPGAEERICSDLAWVGLQWDEGPQVGGPYGPYKQSERTHIYQEHADRLLASGHAYRCFCSAERLNQLAERRSRLGLPTDYDRTCASIAREESDDRAHNGEAFTVRLKVPETYPEQNDLVYGQVGRKARKGAMRKLGELVYEDPILLKSDGLPTYHLANVVDDHAMRITHVVRATEWMSSTPKHLALYDAFGWTPPAFAHVGLLLDSHRNKLSKRNAAVDVESYRAEGIFPEALVNFCALLGWSHERTDDFMTLDDLVDNFTLKFTRGDALVTFKKLDYLQREHGRQRIADPESPTYAQAAEGVLKLLKRQSDTEANWTLLETERERRDRIAVLLAYDRQNIGYSGPGDFLNRHRAFFVRDLRLGVDELDGRRRRKPEDLQTALAVLPIALEMLRDVQPRLWVQSGLSAAFDRTITRIELGDSGVFPNDVLADPARRDSIRKMYLPKLIRWAAFREPGPPIYDSLTIIGKEVALQRIEKAIEELKAEAKRRNEEETARPVGELLSDRRDSRSITTGGIAL